VPVPFAPFFDFDLVFCCFWSFVLTSKPMDAAVSAIHLAIVEVAFLYKWYLARKICGSLRPDVV
jgi:hypothetical protein